MIQMINRIVDDQDYDFDELRGIHTVYSKNDHQDHIGSPN